MPWYTIVTTVLTLLSVPTVFGFIWKDIYEKKSKSSLEKKERKKQEEIESVRSVIREEIKPLNTKIDLMGAKLDKDSNGTLCTLRNDILRCYYDCVEKGYRNDFDYTNIHDLYDAYKALNGNSFVEDVMVRFDSLPTREEYRKRMIKDKNTRNQKEEGTDEL